MTLLIGITKDIRKKSAKPSNFNLYHLIWRIRLQYSKIREIRSCFFDQSEKSSISFINPTLDVPPSRTGALGWACRRPARGIKLQSLFNESVPACYSEHSVKLSTSWLSAASISCHFLRMISEQLGIKLEQGIIKSIPSQPQSLDIY